MKKAILLVKTRVYSRLRQGVMAGVGSDFSFLRQADDGAWLLFLLT